MELHDPELLERNKFFWNDLGRVEEINPKSKFLLLIDYLDGELPFRAIAGLDGIPKVLAVDVGVLARQNLRFFPDKTRLSLLALPMPLDKL